MITSGFAPVPAFDGGAVECLSTVLLDKNEKKARYQYIVCTIFDKRIDESEYKLTKFIQIYVGRLEKILEKIFNKICRLFNRPKNFSVYNYKLIRYLLKNKIEADYILLENSMDIFGNILKIYGPEAKYIFHLHNDFNSNSKSPEMADLVAENCYRLLFVSEYLKRRFQSIVNVDDKKCRVLYNCTDLENLVLDDDIVKYRSSLNLKNEDFVFLYVGRINEEKGTLELAKAFSNLNISNAKLVICGGTWGKEFRSNRYLGQVQKEFQCNKNNVIFTGYIDVEVMTQYYALADVVVIPSICNEAFGMVMLEASKYGCPVIATKSGGMMEIVPPNGALWIENNSNIVTGLTKALNYAYYNIREMRIKTEAAKKYVVTCGKFSEEDYLNNFWLCLEE